MILLTQFQINKNILNSLKTINQRGNCVFMSPHNYILNIGLVYISSSGACSSYGMYIGELPNLPSLKMEKSLVYIDGIVNGISYTSEFKWQLKGPIIEKEFYRVKSFFLILVISNISETFFSEE